MTDVAWVIVGLWMVTFVVAMYFAALWLEASYRLQQLRSSLNGDTTDQR